jgi:apolipoprotein N-acyltransferase
LNNERKFTIQFLIFFFFSFIFCSQIPWLVKSVSQFFTGRITGFGLAPLVLAYLFFLFFTPAAPEKGINFVFFFLILYPDS